MKNKIEKFGINIFYFTSFILGCLFIMEYLPELFRIIFSNPKLHGNLFNFVFIIIWNLATMRFFVDKKLNEEQLNICIYITGWLSLILMILYLATYNQVVEYEKEPIQRIIYFNLPWVYFFLSWINLRKMKSKFN